MNKLIEIFTKLGNYYDQLTAHLLRLRWIKVPREEFIKRHHLEDASLEQRDKLYRRLTRRYGFIVFCISFVLTLVPDNLVIVAISCVLDVALFQYFLFRAMQKIMIIYGHEVDLTTDEEKGKAALMTVVSSGVMLGKHPLLQRMKSVIGYAGRQFIKYIGPRFVAKLTRGFAVALRRQALKWAAIFLTKENVNMMLNMLIPITCAFISGLVSTIIIVPMCNKLQKKLRANLTEDNSLKEN